MSLSVQHLSDEAVAAFADGALGAGGRERAVKHLGECPECTYAVAVQREAVWALRAAPAPALPLGLMDRLRAVPSTTPLTTLPLALTADGQPAFRAHSTHTDGGRGLPMPMSIQARRRTGHIAMLTVAAAAVAMGVAASSSGATGAIAGTSQPGTSPAVAPAVFTPPGLTNVDFDPTLLRSGSGSAGR